MWRTILASTLAAWAVLAVASGAIAQTKAVVVCIDEIAVAGDSQDNPQIDAVRLAKELSGRDLADGKAVRAVVITEKKPSAAKARMEQEGCGYLVRTWRHWMDTEDNTASMRDMDTLVFEVRDLSSRRVIFAGQTRPATIYAKQGHRLYWPFPVIAKEITAKLK
jgi:hypothetical protein